jgi:anti-sigma-K factor RskA
MTTRTPFPTPEDDMLAAEYALGVLQGPDRDAFAARLANEPALAAALRQWEEQLHPMADAIAPVAPPARLQKSLETRLFGADQPMQKTSLWNSLGFWRALAGASLAVVLGLGAWSLRPVDNPQSPAALVAQVAGETKAVSLVAYYDATTGDLRINRTDGAPASGRSFELWIIAGKDAPVSLGVLPDQTPSRHSIPVALREKFKGGVLAISDEPKGGSPTGAPTGAVLATGALTEV